MISLQQQLRLGLKLTPQQVQYLKLLQLPTLALEQRIKMELEINPMLETNEELETDTDEQEAQTEEELERSEEDAYTIEDYINDDLAGFKSPERVPTSDEEESFDPPLPSVIPLSERLLGQFRLMEVDDEDFLLAEEILGNVDEDGYLRRDLALIVQDLNLTFGLSITIEKAESVLQRLQALDPPGIASRNLQECLLAQLRTGSAPPALRELAIRIVQHFFEDFKLKRFDALEKSLGIKRETLRKVHDLIQHLNPKPGEGEFGAQENYITPDFLVQKDEGDFIILLNDRNIPPLRINTAYKELVTPKGKKVSAEAKDFVKKKFEAAKWFIASIHQRRQTLLNVMKAIVHQQRTWFDEGEGLRPMIYKDVSGVVGVDISTISRVVNSKFVQTEFGVFPLRYFFTSGLESESGDDVSNFAVKQQVKEIISTEDANAPLNDDRIAEILKADGLHIARRTVAKYREQLGLPIARLRKKV
jgi:RNA polymerase sigma-54 factor